MIYKITSEEDYKKALEEIYSLWNCDLETSDGKRFIFLADLIDEYEKKHYPI